MVDSIVSDSDRKIHMRESEKNDDDDDDDGGGGSNKTKEDNFTGYHIRYGGRRKEQQRSKSCHTHKTS